MKRSFIATIVAVSLLLTGVAFASQAGDAAVTPQPQHHSLPASCTFQHFRPFAKKVWAVKHWDRKDPDQKAIDAFHRRLSCAPSGHRKAMKDYWAKEKTAFYAHRAKMLFRERITPYYCAGTYWATECEIPLHESGYGSGGGNLYGLLDAWDVQGCQEFAETAWEATKRQQDICAHRHWDEYGRGGWPSY
jgi:hypothetical protein